MEKVALNYWVIKKREKEKSLHNLEALNFRTYSAV